MKQLVRMCRRAVVLACVFLSACQVTLNGVSLEKSRLTAAQRVVVVSLVGDLMTLESSVPSLASQSILEWQFDRLIESRVEQSIARVYGVNATLSNVPREGLYVLYRENYAARAERFDWEGVAPKFVRIAESARADFVFVIHKDDFIVDSPRVTRRGLGLYSFRGSCIPYANLSITVLEGRSGKPIAGSNVYLRSSVGGKPVKLEREVRSDLCSVRLSSLSQEQVSYVRAELDRLVGVQVIDDSVLRLAE